MEIKTESTSRGVQSGIWAIFSFELTFVLDGQGGGRPGLRVGVLVLHVKAALGTQERLAGAVGAVALQTLCGLRRTWGVTLCFGQTAVLTTAVLYDLFSRIQPVLVIWREGLCNILGCGGLGGSRAAGEERVGLGVGHLRQLLLVLLLDGRRRRPQGTVGRLADFPLLQTTVTRVLRGAQLPALSSRAPGEVDLIVERSGGDAGGHGGQAVEGLQEGNGLKTRRNRVGARVFIVVHGLSQHRAEGHWGQRSRLLPHSSDLQQGSEGQSADWAVVSLIAQCVCT